MDQNYVLQGACLYVKMPVELDHETGEEVKQTTDRIMAENHVKKIVFDFGDTVFMDSSGIGMIMSRYRALGMRKNCVEAYKANERIRKILCLSGMHKIIAMSETY